VTRTRGGLALRRAALQEGRSGVGQAQRRVQASVAVGRRCEWSQVADSLIDSPTTAESWMDRRLDRFTNRTTAPGAKRAWCDSRQRPTTN